MTIKKTAPEHNHKLVPDSLLNRITGTGDGDPNDDGLYGRIKQTVDCNGRSITTVEDPKSPNSGGIEEVHHDGSFHVREIDEHANGVVSQLDHHTRLYNSGGYSGHTDGHYDHNSESTRRDTTKGDHGRTAGKDIYDGAGGHRFSGQKDDQFHYNTGGKNYSTSNGDVVSEHSGHIHESNDGDVIKAVNGNKHTIVSGGDYGIHVQSGNMDVQIDDGKVRISSGSDVIIKSLTKITLQVGASTVVVTTDGITITGAGSSGVVVNAPSGPVTTHADPAFGTKIQGGGAVAPPTTFK